MSDKSKALEVAIKQIEQNYGKGAVMRLGDEEVRYGHGDADGDHVCRGVGGLSIPGHCSTGMRSGPFILPGISVRFGCRTVTRSVQVGVPRE